MQGDDTSVASQSEADWDQFKPLIDSDIDILQDLKGLSSMYNKDANDLYCRCEAILLKNSGAQIDASTKPSNKTSGTQGKPAALTRAILSQLEEELASLVTTPRSSPSRPNVRDSMLSQHVSVQKKGSTPMFSTPSNMLSSVLGVAAAQPNFNRSGSTPRHVTPLSHSKNGVRSATNMGERSNGIPNKAGQNTPENRVETPLSLHTNSGDIVDQLNAHIVIPGSSASKEVDMDVMDEEKVDDKDSVEIKVEDHIDLQEGADEAMQVDKDESGAQTDFDFSKQNSVQTRSQKRFVKLEKLFNGEKYMYRYMSQNLQSISDILDDQIDRYISRLVSNGVISLEEVSDPAQIRQSDHVAIGRIVTDASLGGRINKNSVLIETSRQIGGGSRTLLHLDDLESWSFFPGQIVALRGHNPDGHRFFVRELIPSTPFVPMTDKVENLKENSNTDPGFRQDKINTSGLHAIIASGPFTTRTNLDYEALDELIRVINTKNPDIVIMSGPFIDMNHSTVRNAEFSNLAELQDGALDDPALFDTSILFERLIIPRLRLINSEIQIVLVNSCMEWGQQMNLWPQPALDSLLFGNTLKAQLPPNVTCFPNPCVFKVNDVSIGISTLDIISHLSREECSYRPKHQNLLTRLASHVVGSGHFYPLFPPYLPNQVAYQFSSLNLEDNIKGQSINKSSHPMQNSSHPVASPIQTGRKAPEVIAGQTNIKQEPVTEINQSPLAKPSNGPGQMLNAMANIDIAMTGLAEYELVDILILPSIMHPFAYAINNSVVVNPSFSAKPMVLGTFSELYIPPTLSNNTTTDLDEMPKIGISSKVDSIDNTSRNTKTPITSSARVDIIRL